MSVKLGESVVMVASTGLWAQVCYRISHHTPSVGLIFGTASLWSHGAQVSQRELARRLGRAHYYLRRIEADDLRLDMPEFIE
jgi:hypothetical protein